LPATALQRPQPQEARPLPSCPAAHLGVQVVVDVCCPDGGEEEQHLVSQKVHGHIQQRPGVGQRLQPASAGQAAVGIPRPAINGVSTADMPTRQHAVSVTNAPPTWRQLALPGGGTAAPARTCRMPSSGWKARPAKGLIWSPLLYLWWMTCSHLQTAAAAARGREGIIIDWAAQSDGEQIGTMASERDGGFANRFMLQPWLPPACPLVSPAHLYPAPMCSMRCCQ
jgi:hypothetical protein